MRVLVATVRGAGGATYEFVLPDPEASIGSGARASLRLPVIDLAAIRVRLVRHPGERLAIHCLPGPGDVRVESPGATAEPPSAQRAESGDDVHIVSLPTRLTVSGVAIALRWESEDDPSVSLSRSLTLSDELLREAVEASRPGTSASAEAPASPLRRGEVAAVIARQASPPERATPTRGRLPLADVFAAAVALVGIAVALVALALLWRSL